MADRRLKFEAEGLFFTSDTHFGHRKMMQLRGFDHHENADVGRTYHDNFLVSQWNSVVGPDDVVIHLGDLTFRGVHETRDIWDRLNGRKLVVPGNHDRTKNLAKQNLEILARLCEIDVVFAGGIEERITLCHFPLAAWDGSDHGSIQLHGHLHTSLTPDPPHRVAPVLDGVRLDVGVDNAWSYDGDLDKAPISATHVYRAANHIRFLQNRKKRGA